jgi:hypothetical protein
MENFNPFKTPVVSIYEQSLNHSQLGFQDPAGMNGQSSSKAMLTFSLQSQNHGSADLKVQGFAKSTIPSLLYHQVF